MISRTLYPAGVRVRRLHVLVLLVVLLAFCLPMLALSVAAEQAPIYISPRPGATLVSPGTTLALRYGPQIDAASVRDALFQVEGSLSGVHAGQVVLSDDARTLIFKPDRAFATGEAVTVRLSSDLRSSAGQALAAVSFSFRISPQPPGRSALSLGDFVPGESDEAPAAAQAPGTNQLVSNDLTLPADFPNYTVTVPANGTADGNLFLGTFSPLSGTRPYLLILDDSGQPVYYKPGNLSAWFIDFKRQPNGWLTYYDTSQGNFTALDSSYNVVSTYTTGNGYYTDLHDLQLLPNGHALLMSYDSEPVDMSEIVEGGSPTATVTGLIVQELDSAKNVVFQWRSWDYFNITDTTEGLTSTVIDYVHGNSVAQDQDGNILISSRHMDEVTKIDRHSGDIIWRMGGKHNQFTLLSDTQWFAHQHDVRRLPNGHLTLWDNRNGLKPLYSRAVEYQVDEVNKQATLVWAYRDTPDGFTAFMGSNQRLANGSTLTGWGSSSTPAVIEVKPDGSKAFELSLQSPLANYRTFRFPWQGFPITDPTLVVTSTGVTTTLAYSWNGASEIASYRVYGGDGVYPNMLLAVQPRTGFEEHTVLAGLQGVFCYFRVLPVDTQGHEMRYSNEVYTGTPCQSQRTYLPWLAQ